MLLLASPAVLPSAKMPGTFCSRSAVLMGTRRRISSAVNVLTVLVESFFSVFLPTPVTMTRCAASVSSLFASAAVAAAAGGGVGFAGAWAKAA